MREPHTVVNVNMWATDRHAELPWTRSWFLGVGVTVAGKKRVDVGHQFKRAEDAGMARAIVLDLVRALAPGAEIRERSKE